jgi:hypothetical protein
MQIQIYKDIYNFTRLGSATSFDPDPNPKNISHTWKIRIRIQQKDPEMTSQLRPDRIQIWILLSKVSNSQFQYYKIRNVA